MTSNVGDRFSNIYLLDVSFEFSVMGCDQNLDLNQINSKPGAK